MDMIEERIDALIYLYQDKISWIDAGLRNKKQELAYALKHCSKQDEYTKDEIDAIEKRIEKEERDRYLMKGFVCELKWLKSTKEDENVGSQETK